MEIDTRVIASMSQGFANTYLLYTACKLDIFDLIGENGATVKEISGKSGVDAQIICKIIRPLVAYGFLIENDLWYGLTEKGSLLTESDINSLKGYVLYCGGVCAKCWSMMAEAARSDMIPYYLAMGTDLFSANGRDEKQYSAFNNMMNFVSQNMVLSDFLSDLEKQINIKKIIDIGGGTGAVISQFLKHFPHALGTIIDLDFVREKALCNLKKNNVEDRCTFLTGNFFEPLIISGDVFILSRVLHDWNDEDCIKILKNVKNDKTDKSVLYVIELIIPEKVTRENLYIYLNDLQIWAVCGGRERKMSEYSKLFEKAGMVCISTQKISSGENIIKVSLKTEMEVGEI